MITLEKLLGKANAEIISPSRTEVRVNGQLSETVRTKLKKYNIIIKQENDYYLLLPSDGESRQLIFDYVFRNKGKLSERYSD